MPRSLRSLLWFVALLGIAASAPARHQRTYADAVPGQFDYYLLSLSWSPAFCEESPQSAECEGSRRYGLVVHGLWPQLQNGARIEHCDVHERVDDRLADGMLDLMPARGLIFHEWSAHGTCSGLGSGDFFALVRRAREQIALPASLQQPLAALTLPTATLLGQLRAANPRLPEGSLVLTCTRQDVPRLREVRICLGRDLQARACAPDVLRAACRAPQLLIPPLR